MIDRSFEFSVSRDDLFITGQPPGDSVYNLRLNLLHQHDFNRIHGKVIEISDEAIENVNAKYKLLFARLWADSDAAKTPLAVLNGANRGWLGQTPGHTSNRELNGRITPQQLIDGIRERLGAKWQVLIIDIGEARTQELEGGLYLARPDTGQREDPRPGQAFAEPIHVFRAAFEAAGLAPGGLAQTEDATLIRISNNIPRVTL